MGVLETPNSGVAILTNCKGKDTRIQHHTALQDYHHRSRRSTGKKPWLFLHTLEAKCLSILYGTVILTEYCKSGKNVHFLLGNRRYAKLVECFPHYQAPKPKKRGEKLTVKLPGILFIFLSLTDKSKERSPCLQWHCETWLYFASLIVTFLPLTPNKRNNKKISDRSQVYSKWTRVV